MELLIFSSEITSHQLFQVVSWVSNSRREFGGCETSGPKPDLVSPEMPKNVKLT